METVARPSVDDELHLLTEWGDPVSHSRVQKAAILSVLVHAAAIITLMSLPASVFQAQPRPAAAVQRVITPLIDPITELTQKAPNKGKVSKEFNAAEVAPRPRVHSPVPLPPATRPAAAREAVIPSMPAPKPAAPKPLPEPPKVDTAIKEPPKTDLPQMPPTPVPQIQAAEKPKLAFENPSGPPPPVAQGHSAIPIPGNAVSEAIRQAARPGSAGGLVVGDQSVGGPGGSGAAVNLPPSPGSPASQLQLLSDPLGVDFKPYLIRVLASVKLHWMAVIPESVRYGRRGSVAIQFSIGRDGNVPKLVIASASGTDALDRAAVAGISASQPFPPLPPEYKGDKIVLQFNFAYNMPKQ
ncbi:MAG TPA: TonB family protein [Bryobacteraceae bacterium]|jgi:TonB family protein